MVCVGSSRFRFSSCMVAARCLLRADRCSLLPPCHWFLFVVCSLLIARCGLLLLFCFLLLAACCFLRADCYFLRVDCCRLLRVGCCVLPVACWWCSKQHAACNMHTQHATGKMQHASCSMLRSTGGHRHKRTRIAARSSSGYTPAQFRTWTGVSCSSS